MPNRSISSKRKELHTYLKRYNVGGYIDKTNNELSEEFGLTYNVVAAELKNLGIKSKRANYTLSSHSLELIDTINAIIAENPNITYQEIANRMGITRQRVHQICKRRAITKASSFVNTMRFNVSENIEDLLGEIVNSGKKINLKELREYSEKYGVSDSSVFKYIKVNSNKLLVKNFLKYYNSDSMADKIREDTKNTNLTCSQLAKKYNTTYGYVWRIRKAMKEQEYER